TKRSGRRSGKEVVVELDNDDKYIDVNDEPSDDYFVDTEGKNSYASGLRRSGRNKDKEVYDSDIAKTMASASKDDEMVCNWKQQYGDAKEIKPAYVKMRMRKFEVAGLNFKLNFTVMFTSIIGNIRQKGVYGEMEGTKTKNYMIHTMLRQSSPKALCNVMLPFKPNQKACLEEVGFGGMVEFNVDRILSKLGLYVVDNFDEKKMEIKFSKGSIVLTKDMIGDILGLKNEGLDILEGNPNIDDEMVCNWKQQYGDAKEIKPAYVKMRMRKFEVAGLNFKLNFIVMFTSIIGNIRQKGVCDTDILEYIKPNINLSNINWCEEAVELNCRGFGHGELEEEFVDEEGDPTPNNIE
nr:major facilitator superfamily domain, general substrate transporter [Tanacetum cinerariifolium]